MKGFPLSPTGLQNCPHWQMWFCLLTYICTLLYTCTHRWKKKRILPHQHTSWCLLLSPGKVSTCWFPKVCAESSTGSIHRPLWKVAHFSPDRTWKRWMRAGWLRSSILGLVHNTVLGEASALSVDPSCVFWRDLIYSCLMFFPCSVSVPYLESS